MGATSQQPGVSEGWYVGERAVVMEGQAWLPLSSRRKRGIVHVNGDFEIC